jgi:NAD dependent epimerase/dehydratase
MGRGAVHGSIPWTGGRALKLEGRKVLVTGADGFIGSHLVEHLDGRGASVRAFALYNSFGSWGWLDALPPQILSRIEVVTGDVRDAACVRQAVQGTDIVMHLAALIAIPFSYRAPESYVDTNIRGTLNVLAAAREAGCQRLLVTSTSEVYGTARYVPIDEAHPMQGQSPYSATKIAADRLAESFWRSFSTPVTIVRPFNTYGPRQSARAVIPTIITQLASGMQEIRLGSLAPTRDFNYVADTCEGFLAIAESDQAVGEEINIATGREISIGDLAHELIRQINPSARVVEDTDRLRPPASEVDRLLGSGEKLRRMTGWAPRYDLAAGLAQTIAWFRDARNLTRYKPGVYGV